jgi:hypothetical protein
MQMLATEAQLNGWGLYIVCTKEKKIIKYCTKDNNIISTIIKN